MRDCVPSEKRISAEALDALQQALEAYAFEFFDHVAKLCAHGGRVTANNKDIRLCIEMLPASDPMRSALERVYRRDTGSQMATQPQDAGNDAGNDASNSNGNDDGDGDDSTLKDAKLHVWVW